MHNKTFYTIFYGYNLITNINKFTRLTPSYQGIYDGQGLGLYITAKLIKLMNGSIVFESDGENQGSTFQCNIPLTSSPT